MALMLPGNDGQPSTARSAFWYGMLICLVRLAFSKMVIFGWQVPEFSGSEFAVAITALGGIRALDKHVNNQNNNGDKQ